MTTSSRYEPGVADTAGFKTNPHFQLTDTQWVMIADLFPNKEMTSKGGHPECENRGCFEGILFVLSTGIQWQKLPKGYGFPSYSTCRRRLLEWTASGQITVAW